MFGNLFDDDINGGTVNSVQGGDQTQPPPSPRSLSGLAGIENQGSTCFLNSALQVLALTPDFRITLFQLSQDELGKLEEKEYNKVREIPLQIQRLFAMLMLEKQQAVSSKDVTDSFGWTNNEVTQQQDAHELFGLLLDAIHQSLHGTSGESIIRRLFYGKSVNKVECRRCGNFSKTEVEFSDLFVQVAGFPKGLEESLHNTFCKPEMMVDINQYRCDICNTLVDAAKTTKLQTLPPILRMSLVRFSYNARTYKRFKITDRFPFPLEIDMSKYTEYGDLTAGAVYELYAVIIHGGSCDGGHYTACIRDIDNLGHWIDPDQEKVQLATEASSRKMDVVECSSPVQLVTLILSSQPEYTMTMDKLSAEILKRTGVSWVKLYKRRYGSFPKFIRDHSHLFHTEGRLVTLQENTLPDATISDCAQMDSLLEEMPEDNVNDNCNIVNGFSVSKGYGSPPPAPGQCWYFFNDSRVSSMHAKDLQNEFGGKESAYLLFYRRKDLPCPTEAEGDPAFGIPEYLLKEVEKKNDLLEKEREEYKHMEQCRKEEEERKAQEIQLDIHFFWTHKLEKGMLSTQEEPVHLTCPRFHTLGQLFTTIAVVGGERLGSSFRIHRMRCWENKTHLFDELKDREKSLEELSVENGTILFVWDGRQVDGQSVPTGLDSEPITLQLKQYCSAFEITHSFPKNLTLKAFHKQIGILTGIPKDQLQLKFPDVTSQGGITVKGETLESIHLRDGDCILFDGNGRNSFAAEVNSFSHLKNAMVNQPDHQFCVYIENRCDERSQRRWPKLELELDKDMSMGEVKQLFMAMYCIYCDAAVLRENDPRKGLQVPYDENKTVGDFGITRNTQMALDNMQMTLTFKLSPQSEPDSPAMQVNILKDCTVETCRDSMAQIAGVSDSSDWHLSKTNFFGEHTDVLDDWTQTLGHYAVNPGDFLLLERGRLPPKGFISLTVWLYASPNPLDTSGLSAITQTVKELPVSNLQTNDYGADNSVHLGELEISRDATLEELRHQVQALLLSRKHLQVKMTQLRLSIIEGRYRQQRRVLRGLRNTLRRLKVNGVNHIGVQVVSQAADPSVDEIVLNLRVRNSNNRSYGEPQELVWDSSKGASASSLKLDIAKRFMVSEDMLVIAKHFPDEFQWRVLTDHIQKQVQGHQSSNNNRKGRKRTHAPKFNIRQKPFFVQDGDVIGVLVTQPTILPSSNIPVLSEDFSTAEDDEGRKQQLEEQRQKQLERQARRLVDGLSGPSPRRPAVPLKIRIGDFT